MRWSQLLIMPSQRILTFLTVAVFIMHHYKYSVITKADYLQRLVCPLFDVYPTTATHYHSLLGCKIPYYHSRLGQAAIARLLQEPSDSPGTPAYMASTSLARASWGVKEVKMLLTLPSSLSSHKDLLVCLLPNSKATTKAKSCHSPPVVPYIQKHVLCA